MSRPPAAGLFLGIFAVLLKTVGPTVSCDDSGEVVLAARQLGVMHPPGYPLYMLLGALAVRVPLASPAFRLSLLAAALAAAAACLLYAAWRRHVPGRDAFGWAACGFAALAVGPWSQATTAKGGVYGLNAVLALGALAASWRPGFAVAAGLAAGLAWANHWMSAAGVAPALLLAAARDGRRAGALSALGALLGLSMYAALPLAAGHRPFLDWGHPATAGRLWTHVSRAQYAGAAAKDRSAGTWERVGALRSAVDGAGSWPVVALLAAAGAAASARASPAAAAGAAAYLAALCGGLLLFPGMRSGAPWYFEVFFIPGILMLAWLAARGAAGAAGRGRLGRAALAALAVAAASALPGRWTRCDRSREYLTEDAALNLAATAPRPALLFAASDAVVFGNWHAWHATGRVRGLAVIPEPLLPMSWIAERFAESIPALRAPFPAPWAGAEAVPALMRAWRDGNRERFALLALRSPEAERAFPGGSAARERWYLVAAPGPGSRTPPARGPGRLRLRGLFGRERVRDPRCAATFQPLYASGFLSWANALLDPARPRPAEARVVLRLASRLAGGPADRAAVALAGGNAAMAEHRPGEASARFASAVALDPGLAVARRNLAMLRLSLGDRAGAYQAYAGLAQCCPDSPEARELSPLMAPLEPPGRLE